MAGPAWLRPRTTFRDEIQEVFCDTVQCVYIAVQVKKVVSFESLLNCHPAGVPARVRVAPRPVEAARPGRRRGVGRRFLAVLLAVPLHGPVQRRPRRVGARRAGAGRRAEGGVREVICTYLIGASTNL